MFREESPATDHGTDDTWNKCITQITQQASIGNPKHPGILEVITNWLKDENFGISLEAEEGKVTCAEVPAFNQLPENEVIWSLH